MLEVGPVTRDFSKCFVNISCLSFTIFRSWYYYYIFPVFTGDMNRAGKKLAKVRAGKREAGIEPPKSLITESRLLNSNFSGGYPRNFYVEPVSRNEVFGAKHFLPQPP